MSHLNGQNGIYRTLHIEMREPGKPWKRIRGDETMNAFMQHGVKYEVRVLNPHFILGWDIEGEPFEAPAQYLPLRD